MDDNRRLSAVESICTKNSQDIAVLQESEKNQAEDISDLQGAFKSLSEMTQTLHTDAELIKNQLGGYNKFLMVIASTLFALLAKSFFGSVFTPPQIISDPATLEKLDTIERRLDQGMPQP